MSIVTDQTYTSDSIQNQLNAAQNCIGTFGCPQPYSHLTPTIYNRRVISIEAVEGGFILNGHFHGKGDQKRVALSPEGLKLILEEWSAQFMACSR